MAAFDIDIEVPPAGSKTGAGPIATASSWTNTRRLSKAGEIAFSMPASDPQAAELQPKRIARCHSLSGSPGARTRTEFGAGIIDRIAVSVALGGGSMVDVSGNDLLDELTTRSVGTLSTVVVTVVVAAQVTHNNAPAGANTLTALTAATDGNAATSSPVTLTSDDYLLIGQATPFDSVRFDVGSTPNGARATWQATYWNGAAWAGVTVGTDGTVVDGQPLAQDGDIAIARPPTWATTTVNGYSGYWLRLAPSANLSANVTLAEVATVTREAGFAAPTAIMAFAPPAWSLDLAQGYGTTLAGVYFQFSGENVLDALIKIADLTNESFRLGADRTVIWSRKDQPSSGLIAIADGDGVALETNPDVVVIKSLAVTSDSHDLVTTVYPYGAGIATARLDISRSDRIPPAGYAVGSNAIGWFLTNDTTAALYGRIERPQSFKDIAVLDTDTNTPQAEPADEIAAANQLFDAALAWLELQSVALMSYDLAVTKVDSALEPGQTIDVQYRKTHDGYREVDIDTIRDGAPLVILEATTEIDESGVRTVALRVATAARWPETDASFLSGMATRQGSMDAHVQPVTQARATRAESATYADSAGIVQDATVAHLTVVQAWTAHQRYSGSAPGIAAGTAAGTTPTISLTGTDEGGLITLTTGTTPLAASAAVCTVTFATAFPVTPKAISIEPANVAAAALSGTADVFVADTGITTTVFVLRVGATALAAGTLYKWWYAIKG